MVSGSYQRRVLAAAATMACVISTIASAHHSFAMYNAQSPITLRGKVTSFRWVSPHAVFSIATDAASGQPSAVWAIELSSPANMTRLGWTHSTIAVGDRVEVTASPMRDGSHGAACRQLKLVNKDKVLECGAGTAIHIGEKPTR
jgi:hypothetical protein